jgi:integrase
MVERAGVEAKLGFPPHPLRHACGFALANKGHDTRALQIKGDWLRHAKFALIPTARPRRFSTPGPVTPYVPVALIQNCGITRVDRSN